MDKLPDIELLNQDGHSIKTIEAWSGKELLIVFLSLYCKRRIELLPDLEKVKQHGLLLIVVTNGEVEENRDISDHFGWDIPLISLNNNDMGEYFKVFETPTIQIYSKEGSLLSKGIINYADDITFYVDSIGSKTTLGEVRE